MGILKKFNIILLSSALVFASGASEFLKVYKNIVEVYAEEIIPEFIINDGVLVKYLGKQQEVIIPEGVTSIGKSAFEYNGYVESVIIPEGVTSIEYRAFKQVGKLKNIKLPQSPKEIGEEAFYACDIRQLELPDTLIKIGPHAFESNYYIESIKIPKGLTEIEEGVFKNIHKLSKIVIPENIKSIGNYAFDYCGLKEVEMTDNLNFIGKGAFRGCSQLENIELPKSIALISDELFYGCESLKNINIGEDYIYIYR